MNSEGIYNDCSNCKEFINCCFSFDKINAPTLSKYEVEKISRNHSNFYDVVGENLYTLKIINNTCIFL